MISLCAGRTWLASISTLGYLGRLDMILPVMAHLHSCTAELSQQSVSPRHMCDYLGSWNETMLPRRLQSYYT